MQRHFPYQHPTFGTDKRPKADFYWKNTVYYWWWQYLKRNADYVATCEKGGKGKCAKLFEDFGDVRGDSFKEWWLEGGRNVRCFAEPPTPSIQVVDPANVAEHVSARVLLLAVPLNLPMKHLAQRFREVVSKHHDGQRGVRMSTKSQARYPVQGKVDLDFLEDALRVWDARKAEPLKPWWQIAQDLRVVPSEHWVRGNDDPSAAAKKNVLAATASRLYRKAERIIANVGEGRFPVTK